MYGCLVRSAEEMTSALNAVSHTCRFIPFLISRSDFDVIFVQYLVHGLPLYMALLFAVITCSLPAGLAGKTTGFPILTSTANSYPWTNIF
jgi:branched-subunit amino acid transport protein AzlD